MKAHSATHQHQKSNSIFQFLPGPVKIKDGLFMGDQIAARDIQFIYSNKVTHIINTVSKRVPNLWQKFGIHYLSVNWTEKQQNIFDKKNNSVNTIYHFIQEAMQQGQSCLIHSVNGKSRACSVLVAYLMKKFTWSLDKCLQFTASKKQNLQIRNGFLIQLQQLQQRMSQIYNLTSQWNYSKNQEELVLRNTFVNSKPLGIDKTSQNTQKKSKKKVNWSEKPVVISNNPNTSTNSKSVQSRAMTTFKQSANIQIKSILKGDPGFQQRQINAKQKNNNQIEQNQQLQSNNGSLGRKEGKFINNINGNIVHVTVNNFITSEKKPDTPQTKNPVNTRPYSSDQKDREKQKKQTNQKKLLSTNYDVNPMTSFKSPYDMAGSIKSGPARVGIGNVVMGGTSGPYKSIKNNQKQKQSKNISTQERPQSAKGRPPSFGNTNTRFKQDLIITNGLANVIKNKYPNLNTKDQMLKRR